MNHSQMVEAGVRPISFGTRFTATQAFDALFAEATRLVEETANYLDGQGRADAETLQGEAPLAYAQESMRLSTRLMRLMSSLIIRRAVAEGHMDGEEAARERSRAERHADMPPVVETLRLLPQGLSDLIVATTRLEMRILHLDASESQDVPRPSPVRREQNLLKAVFGAGAACA